MPSTPRIITMDWPADTRLTLDALRGLLAAPGERRQWHIRVTGVEQIFAAHDLPNFCPVQNYRRGIRPVNEQEIGACEYARFFGTDCPIFAGDAE